MVATRYRQGNYSAAPYTCCSGLLVIRYTDTMQDTEKQEARPRTVGEALRHCSDALANASLYYGHGTDNAWDEAVQLVLAVADLPPDADATTLAHPLDDAALSRIDSLLRRRIAERIPLPYLIGRAWFAGLPFHCDRRALIPRSPIAELIRNDFRPWYSGPAPERILDLCCGGGSIGLAAAVYCGSARVDLVDVDEDALDLAHRNAQLHGIEGQVEILQSDLYEQLDGCRYDLILCNPPYVNDADLAAMPAEYRAEPRFALEAGGDGLALAHRVLAGAGAHMTEQGLLVVELGASWPALEAAYPEVPFTWVDFEHGGEGVCVLTAREWQDYSESWLR